MKAHIRWIFFQNQEVSKLILNGTNNENWPNVKKYANDLKKWHKSLDRQQQKINLLKIKNNKTRQLMANVQTWFINEHNLLSKPAKRKLAEIQDKLRRLEQELRINENNLKNPKKHLEDYEKQSLERKIRIQKRKIGHCKDELTEAEQAFEQEKKELCERLTYEKHELEPFLRNPEENIDPITRQLIITSKHYSEWWRIFRDIDEESKPLAELNKCLDEWYTHNGGNGPEYNPYEIWVQEKTDDTITFLWKPIEIELESTNEKGEKINVKGKFLPLLRNYLFNYYGEWFEYVDHWQSNYDSVIILAQRSIFYNDYWRLLKSQGNVILHHSSLVDSKKEICSCPSYEVYTSRTIFVLDYELLFDCYRVGKSEAKKIFLIDDPAIQMTGGGVPSKIDAKQEHKE